MPASTSVQRFEFEVVPAGIDPFNGFTAEELAAAPFEPFVFEVPTMNGADAAARRAWWSAFHLLGPRGVEPEQFEVFELVGGCFRGRQVTMGGFLRTDAENLELDHELERSETDDYREGPEVSA